MFMFSFMFVLYNNVNIFVFWELAESHFNFPVNVKSLYCFTASWHVHVHFNNAKCLVCAVNVFRTQSWCKNYELRFFSFVVLFSLFPIDFVLMRFECPLVCAERWGRSGAQGLAEWRNFNLKPLGGGSCGLRPKERHSSENWSGLQSWGAAPAATPPLLPPLFFRSLLHWQPTGALSIFSFHTPKLNHELNKHIFPSIEKMWRNVSSLHSKLGA